MYISTIFSSQTFVYSIYSNQRPVIRVVLSVVSVCVSVYVTTKICIFRLSSDCVGFEYGKNFRLSVSILAASGLAEFKYVFRDHHILDTQYMVQCLETIYENRFPYTMTLMVIMIVIISMFGIEFCNLYCMLYSSDSLGNKMRKFQTDDLS